MLHDIDAGTCKANAVSDFMHWPSVVSTPKL